MAQYDLALAFARQLSAWGVRHVFGLTGDDILPFLDALGRAGGIEFIGASHESGAAFMAASYAKLTGGLGVCVSSAAGAVNLLEGLAEAFLDGTPVLALTGQVETAKIGTRAKQYFDQQRLIGSFAAYSEPVTNAQAGVGLLIRAMAQALFHHTVAHLSIPKDLWRQTVEAEPGSFPPLVASRGDSVRIQGDQERAVALMRQGRRPLLVAGGAARGLGVEVRQLAASWGAAVVTAQEAKGVVRDEWPEVLGGIGEGWTPGLIGEADCVLLLGSAGYEGNYLPKVATIQVQRQPWLIEEAYLWDSLAGDMGQIVAFLTQGLADRKPDGAWLGRIAQAREERETMRAADADRGGRPIHPARLMAILSRVVHEDAILTLDEGAFIHWFDRDFAAAEQSVMLSWRWRSMGAGVPAALAARLAFPQRQVIALVGDGGLLMTLGELATAAQHGLRLTVVVISNRLYGLEADKALASGLKPVGLGIHTPDFARCAQAFGLQDSRVEEPEQLERTLRDALDSEGLSLVDVVCADARLPAMPMG